jgi:branched-chain amino acid transport system substrate-binding protein
MQVAMLVPEAAAMKKSAGPWCSPITSSPVGRRDLQTLFAQPDVCRRNRAFPLGKGWIWVAVAPSDAKPDAIFNVLFGADLSLLCVNTRPVPGPKWSAC